MHKYLIPLLLIFLCLACADDDDDGFPIGPYCLQPEDFTNCLNFRDLSEQDHFDALVGEWINVETSGGMIANPNRRSCGVLEASDFRMIFSADSTITTISGGDAVTTGTWSIGADTLSDGSIITVLNSDAIFRFSAPANLCDGNLSFTDYLAIDWVLNIFLKE